MIPILTQYQQLQKSQGIKLTGAALLIAPWLLWLTSKKTLSRNDRLSLMVISAGMIYFNASSYLKMKKLALNLADQLPEKIQSGQIIDDVLEQKLSILPDDSSQGLPVGEQTQITTKPLSNQTQITTKPPEPASTTSTQQTTPNNWEYGPEGFPIPV